MASSDGVEKSHPVEEVSLVVPETDEPNLPAFTFRSCVLGVVFCALLISLNTFFSFRTQPLTISPILAQILALPVGRFLAFALPNKRVNLVGDWEFDLNPGPFNIKEHVIITVFANCGVAYGGDAYSIGVISVMKRFYKQNVSFLCAFFIVVSQQMLGYGWAGMLRRYLVKPAEMWWPSNLAQVSLFRALHEKEAKSGLTRMKFFGIFFTASFLYYALPGYLIPVLTFFSWICWIWPHSITAQQIGSGYHGLGIGAFSFDWAGISAYHGSPLVTPWSSILNTAVGFIIFAYIIMPLCYWKYNTFDARKFPMISKKLFTSSGQVYDVTKVLTPQYDLNVAAYNSYGKLYLSSFFALSVIGSGFARFTATFTHVFLFHGRDLWNQSKSVVKESTLDIHERLMKKYKKVPHWWFLIILIGSIGLSLVVSFVWKADVQLPWWGMILGVGLAFIVTLPLGVIQATTNQQPGYDMIAQILIGYLLPGKPIANLLFKIYGHISSVNALSLLADLKLGHYMKIPPRSMFTAQLLGTLISGTLNLIIAWLMMNNIENMCDADSLPADSPWTCPMFHLQFDASVIWGLIGPARLFGPGETYRNLLWLFLVGAILPFPAYVLTRIYPEKKWIAMINVPIIAYGFAGMPPATPTNIASWLITGTIFNYFVFRYRKQWWRRYNYVLSAALDAGTAFMGVLLFLALQNSGKKLRWWGTELDHCPLANCPTEPGIAVPGCPIF